MSDSGARASSPALLRKDGEAAKAAGDSRAPNAPNAPAPKGWHKRGFLPHCDVARLHQIITYRLADSLPKEVALALLEKARNAGEGTRAPIEAYLDAGHGECLLRRPEIAQLVLDSWQYFDGQRYDLKAWVIMPNHVHVLIGMRDCSLSEIVKGWKSVTSRQMNAVLGRRGRRWQEDYWDRFIRDENHYVAAVDYIQHNPAKAGLVDWPWVGEGEGEGARLSSAAFRGT